MERIIEPELLDHIDPQSSEARRSRFDLRLINFLMGGERWILDEIGQHPEIRRVLELGAGEGWLAQRIAHRYPQLEVLALDQVPAPPDLGSGVEWIQGDVMEQSTHCGAETLVVANMFLHHFDEEQLGRIGAAYGGAGVWLCHEPLRTRATLNLARCMLPFVGAVTRHDMLVSIRAGFVECALGEQLAESCQWDEQRSVFGGLRSKAVRR
ncbi:class I SAM-dependent methyltransferase [Rubritalea marina]|uniref:class I SAM-dependent methyltransferase n=1 Tax=Rubritalea marina TaxID=361055 RepID=UPI00036FF396|nr:class I SAM-dependent methyltransferase [Rubritalea marina]